MSSVGDSDEVEVDVDVAKVDGVEGVDADGDDDVQDPDFVASDGLRKSLRANKGVSALRYYEEHPLGGFEATFPARKRRPRRPREPKMVVKLNASRTRIVRFGGVPYLIPRHFVVRQPELTKAAPERDPEYCGRRKDRGVVVYGQYLSCLWDGCGYWTDAEESLKIHEESVHLSWIAELFADTLSKARAEAVCDRGSAFVCRLCHRRFKDEDACLEHALAAHRNRFKPVMCLECEYTARHPRQLKEHYKLTHVETTPIGPNDDDVEAASKKPRRPRTHHVCGVVDGDDEPCQFSCRQEAELARHKFKVHGGRGGQFLCPTCGVAFHLWAKRRLHEGKEHGHFYCRYKRFFGCDFTGSSFDEIQEHVAAAHSAQGERAPKIQCTQCGMCVAAASMKKHLAAVHGAVRRCDRCDFESTNAAEFEQHGLSRHADVCDRCGLAVDRGEAGSHEDNCPAVLGAGPPVVGEKHPTLKAVHGYTFLKNKLKACNFCSFTARLKKTVGRHVALMHKKQPCPAASCQAEMNNRPELVEHLQSCHPDLCINCGVPRLPDHSCERTQFHEHCPMLERIHEEYRSLACPQCGNLIIGKSGLNRHIACKHNKDEHSLKKPVVTFKCKSCDFESKQVREFEKHLLYVHSNVCNTCGLPMEVISNVAKSCTHECPAVIMVESVEIPEEKIRKKNPDHLLLEDRSYVCMLCGFSCYSAVTRQRHMALMHKEQHCPNMSCPAVFGNRIELTDHLQLHHPEMCSNCGIERLPEHDCDRTLFFEMNPMTVRLPIAVRPLPCAVCHARLAGEVQLRNHVRDQHGMSLTEYMKS